MILKRSTLILIIFQTILLQNQIVEPKRRDEIDENILLKRCELIYFNKPSTNDLISQCIETVRKPGKCPKNLIGGISSCLEECNSQKDYKCAGTKKCCQQQCGWICQEPEIDSFIDKMLPPIPFNLQTPDTTKRSKKGRSCELSWEIPLNFTYKLPIYSIVEGRSHIGNVYSPHKLGEWEWFKFQLIAQVVHHKTYSRKTYAKLKLRKGRWYQFRVATLNENGFKGYSKTSKPYRLSDYHVHVSDPAPPQPPKNLEIAVTPILLPNNSVYAKATWDAPKSDLPIEKYRVNWALYIKSENSSLFLSEAYVKEPIHYYEFWNLNVNSVYYVQVQAIAINGKRRPKSSKESILLNTTLPIKYSQNNEFNNNNLNIHQRGINSTGYSVTNRILSKSNNRHSNRPDLMVKFIPNKKYGMLVRITFAKDSFHDKMLLELCPGISDCEIREYEATKAKKDQIDFSNLLFNKQYTVRLIDTNIKRNQIILLKTFTTPKCDIWLKWYPNLSLNC